MMIILFVGQIYQGLQALLLQNFKLFTRLALEFPAEVDFVKFEKNTFFCKFPTKSWHFLKSKISKLFYFVLIFSQYTFFQKRHAASWQCGETRLPSGCSWTRRSPALNVVIFLSSLKISFRIFKTNHTRFDLNNATNLYT